MPKSLTYSVTESLGGTCLVNNIKVRAACGVDGKFVYKGGTNPAKSFKCVAAAFNNQDPALEKMKGCYVYLYPWETGTRFTAIQCMQSLPENTAGFVSSPYLLARFDVGAAGNSHRDSSLEGEPSLMTSTPEAFSGPICTSS